MNIRNVFLLIAGIFFVGFLSHAVYLKKTVYGDGIFYYSFLRSVVFDHDIDFRNEFAHFSVRTNATSRGLPSNKYSVGPAILWAPGYLLTHALIKGDGYEFPYQMTVGATSVLFALFGLMLLFRILTQFFSEKACLLATLSLAITTNLFFYGSLDAVNSHALSFFAAALFMTFLLEKKRQWFIIGLSLGLLGIIRTQDLVYTVLLMSVIDSDLFIPGIRHQTMIQFDILIPGIARFLTGFLGISFFQLIVWQILYGTIFINPYIAGGEGFDFLHPHIFEVLFSFQNGLFLYSPILIVGITGLVFWKNNLRLYLSLILLLALLTTASWSTWWQGANYGGRMFVSTLPIFGFGLAAAFSAGLKRIRLQPKTFILLIGSLGIMNVFLIVTFLLRT